MAVWIKLGVEVPGKVVRTWDEDTETTTLQLSEAQAKVVLEQLSPALAFFDAQHK